MITAIRNKLFAPASYDDLGVESYKTIRRQLAEAEGLARDDVMPVVTERIRSLETHLRTPLDEPSWGPSGWFNTRKPTNPKRSVWSFFRSDDNNGAGDVSPQLTVGAATADIHEVIARNIDQSQRYHSFRWLYAGAILFGLGVFGLAMAVDYNIMSEFWTRALANEFLEVPPTLAQSILFKSFQVVIATVAFHFFLGLFGVAGRLTLIIVSFLLSIIMVLGFGLINTGQALPADKAALLHPTMSQFQAPANDPFAEFGIGTPTQASVVTAPSAALAPSESVQMASNLSWIVAPAIVFLVVTSVAALCLHMAEGNLKNFVKAGDFNRRRKREGEWRALRILENQLSNRGERSA